MPPRKGSCRNKIKGVACDPMYIVTSNIFQSITPDWSSLSYDHPRWRGKLIFSCVWTCEWSIWLNMAGSRHSSQSSRRDFFPPCTSVTLVAFILGLGEVLSRDDESAPSSSRLTSTLALNCNTDCLFLSGPNPHPRG